MYKTILVKDLVQEGENLINRLEARRFQIAAAFWHYIEDLMRWRLVIVFSTLIEREGPLRAYMRIQEILEEMDAKALSVSDISVMGLNGSAFRELRSEIERSGRVTSHRPMSTSRDIWFHDVYIYRWRDGRPRPHRA